MHCLSKHDIFLLKRPLVVFRRLAHGIDWNSPYGLKARFIFLFSEMKMYMCRY